MVVSVGGKAIRRPEGDAGVEEALEELRGQAQQAIGETLGNYSTVEILQQAESVCYICRTAISIGSQEQEAKFIEEFKAEQFPEDMLVFGVYQLLLSVMKQRSPTEELLVGTPESVDGLEVRCYPESMYAIIHFTCPTQNYQPPDSLPERTALIYPHGECRFGFGARLGTVSLTWHLIASLSTAKKSRQNSDIVDTVVLDTRTELLRRSTINPTSDPEDGAKSARDGDLLGRMTLYIGPGKERGPSLDLESRLAIVESNANSAEH
jgi:hypothetical protein